MTKQAPPVLEKGELHAALGEAISTVLWNAVEGGLSMDQAVCVVTAVAADYARVHFGDDYLPCLAEVVTSRAHFNKPRILDTKPDA